jgi:polyferredoxin
MNDAPLATWWLKRRWLVQLLSTVLANSAFLSRFRGLCYPALNCWSCPSANFACPIGALQNSAAGTRLALAADSPLWRSLPLYTLGTLLLWGSVFGRMMCGWLCPFGWFQELVGRRGPKWRVSRRLWYVRYVVLVALVFVIPYLTGEAWFSKLCPMGALEGSIPQPLLHPELRSQIGAMWYLKLGILAVTIVAAYLWRRPFCGTACPLGALFSLTNRFSAWQISHLRARCVNCEWCVRECPQGLDPRTDVNSHACVSCLHCTRCPYGALRSHAAWRSPEASKEEVTANE